MFKRYLTTISHAAIAISSLCLAALSPITAYGQNYSVEINKTKVLQIPAPAAAVVVGNPAIADVSVHSPTMLFIVGRGYGVTNVIILDELGQTIMDADIQVGNNKSNSGKRVLLAGKGWQSFDCNPFCQPAPVLGDDPKFLAQFKGQGQTIDNTNTPITTTSFATQQTSQPVIGSALPQFPVPTEFDPEPMIPEIQQMSPPTRSGFGRGSSEY